MVEQGEVYDLQVRGVHHRVIVVSSNVHNTVMAPWVVPVRHGVLDAPPYAVPLHDTDPLGGTADVNRLARAAPTGQPLGMITGGTMARIRDAIATVFAG